MEPENPFLTPSADVATTAAPHPDSMLLAERGTRLGAVMIDGLCAFAALIPAMVGGFSRVSSGSPLWFLGTDIPSMLGSVLWVGLMILQGYLIAVRGQSIGKRLLGIKIVRLDGSPPGLVHGVLIRTWAIAIVNYLPVVGTGVGGLLGLVDALMIFSDERRCLHDRIAGTKVVVAELTGAP